MLRRPDETLQRRLTAQDGSATWISMRSPAELRSVAPAGVEGATDRSPVAECQINDTAQAAVGGRVVHRDPARRDRRAPVAIAVGAAGDLGVRWPSERPWPQA